MTAATATRQDSKWNSTSIVAPANAQTNSGQFHGRAITPSVAAAAIVQMTELKQHQLARTTTAAAREIQWYPVVAPTLPLKTL